MKPDDSLVGTNMFILRRQSMISQKVMAKRLGVSSSFLCQLEAGRRHWTPEMVAKFKEVCRKV